MDRLDADAITEDHRFNPWSDQQSNVVFQPPRLSLWFPGVRRPTPCDRPSANVAVGQQRCRVGPCGLLRFGDEPSSNFAWF